MTQFKLDWFSAAVLVNPDATHQIASYRDKAVGGAWTNTGFTPAGNIPKYIQSAISPSLADNKVWEFKVESICTTGGPIINDNGIKEDIKFACLVPILAQTTNSGTITLNVLGLGISKATFTLFKASDNSVVSGPTTVAKVGNTITLTVSTLTDATEYYWEYTIYATVNGTEVQSNDATQLGASCQSIHFTTDAGICEPMTSITANATEF